MTSDIASSSTVNKMEETLLVENESGQSSSIEIQTDEITPEIYKRVNLHISANIEIEKNNFDDTNI